MHNDTICLYNYALAYKNVNSEHTFKQRSSQHCILVTRSNFVKTFDFAQGMSLKTLQIYSAQALYMDVVTRSIL